MLTTTRQAPKWFCSRGRCAHQAINFCGAPSSNKQPWLPPFSSALLLGGRTTPLAVLHRKSSDESSLPVIVRLAAALSSNELASAVADLLPGVFCDS
jgi:hypothetical protein